MSQDLAIDRLLREHADFARRLARSLLRDWSAAEDLSQEAWRVAIERRPDAIADFRAWLGGVIRNLARMHLRGEAARRRREQQAAASAAAPEAAAARLDQLELLVAALRRLREPFRTTIVLRYEQGLPPREIARRTGVALGTVKSRLKRGLALLRADLVAAHDGDEQAWRRGLAMLLVVPGRRVLQVALAAAGVVACLGVWQARRVPEPDAERMVSPGALAAPGAAHLPGATVVRLPAAAASGADQAQRRRVLRLVDAGTGEALPDFIVAAPALDPPLLVSDGEGRLVLSGGDADASIELHLIDDARLPRGEQSAAELVHDELRVRVGPTYRLDLHPAPGAADRWHARLSALDARHEHRTSFAPVRGEEDAWVRFAADAADLRGGPPWRLEVRSDDGFRFGQAVVESVSGVLPGRVRVEMAATGRVAGRILQPDGAPIDQAEVMLAGTAGTRVTTSDPGGRFELPWIAPGAYELTARSRLHVAASTRPAVHEMAVAETELRLMPLVLGAVTGVLRSAGGVAAAPPPGPITLVLGSRDDPERAFLQTLEVNAPHDGVLARFRFDGVPAGDYDLTVRASDFCRWQPASLRIAPPRSDVEMVRLDTQPAADVLLQAIDAATGAPLARFEAFVCLDDAADGSKVLAGEGGRLLLRRVPLDAMLRWTLRAEDHAAVRGDRAAAALPVRLQPGWANTVRCVDRARRPVAGVRLRLDGVETAAADAGGNLRLLARRRPARIVLADGPWVLAGGDLFADGGFRDLIWGMTVVVERPDATGNEEKKR